MTTEYGRIRRRLFSIQAMVTPHLEVMEMHLKNANELVQLDPNPSFVNNMVDLETKLEIEIHAIESIRSNWDSTLSNILQIHIPFLDKFGLTPPSQQP